MLHISYLQAIFLSNFASMKATNVMILSYLVCLANLFSLNASESRYPFEYITAPESQKPQVVLLFASNV